MSIMHRDTVTLYNYVGEVDYHASYSKTILKFVDCDSAFGVRMSNRGIASDDKAKLYIFDKYVRAESIDGTIKQYMPYEAWMQSSHKEQYWTISPEGADYFAEGISDDADPPKQAFRITSAAHYGKGSPRMWHWEMSGA